MSLHHLHPESRSTPRLVKKSTSLGQATVRMASGSAALTISASNNLPNSGMRTLKSISLVSLVPPSSGSTVNTTVAPTMPRFWQANRLLGTYWV